MRMMQYGMKGTTNSLPTVIRVLEGRLMYWIISECRRRVSSRPFVPFLIVETFPHLAQVNSLPEMEAPLPNEV